MTQAWKSLVWVVCILLVGATCGRLLSTTSRVPEPSVAPATPRASEGPTEAQALRDIRAGYDRMEDALNMTDVRSYMAVLAPDYVRVEVNGSVRNYSQWLMAPGLEKGWPSLGFRVLSASVQGRRATVQEEETTTFYMRVMRCGAPVPLGIEIKAVCEDTWSLTSDGWKLSRQKQVSATLFDRGKPVRSIPARP